MKVYVSVDLEGVGGVCTRAEVFDLDRSSPDYQRSQGLMTEEVNAAVAGAFDAGATEVTVNDSHGSMRNLLVDRLDPRVRLIRGAVKPGLMTAGLRPDHDAALFLGYHARAGMPGVLAHTLNGAQLTGVHLDGTPVGEIALSALSAHEAGVPVAFLSGDEHACDEARQLLGHELTCFATKRAVDRSTADLVPPEACRTGIQSGVRAALSVPLDRPQPPTGPHLFRIGWRSTTAARVASWVPGVEQLDESTTQFEAPTVSAGIDLLVVLLLAATGLDA